MINFIFSKCRIILLMLLLITMVVQLSPIGLGGGYEKFRLLVMIVTGLLFLLSCQNMKKMWAIGIWRCLMLTVVGEIVLLGLLVIVGASVNWSPIVDLLMVVMFVVISLMELTQKQYRRILNLFIWGTLYSGISIIFTYGSGFVINDLYMPVPKNQIAPILSTGFFVSFFEGNNTNRNINKCYYWGMAFLLFLCICVFRARANIVAILVGLIVYFVFYKRKLGMLLWSGVLVVLVLIFTPLGEFVYNALFFFFYVTDLNSVSAGRTNTYGASLDFIEKHGLLGGLYASIENYHHGNVHNYLLYTLENYGLLGGCLLILFYLRLIFEIGERNILRNKNKADMLGCFVFIVPLVVSLFEYTYPYSPGSAVFMAYFCLGQYYCKCSFRQKSIWIESRAIE